MQGSTLCLIALFIACTLVYNSNNTVHLLTQTGETIKHNQPHTQVDFRAFQSLRFHLLPGLNIHGVIRTTEDKIGPRAYLQFSKEITEMIPLTLFGAILVRLATYQLPSGHGHSSESF